MPYFDYTDPDDTLLLHSSVRDHTELENVSSQVEYDVIDHYTEEYPEIRFETYDPDGEIQTAVKLHGYAADPANASENLKEALRRTIAGVISDCLRQYDNERNIQSETFSKRSYTYAGKSLTKDDWPDGWDRRLAKFDNREVVYGL